MTEDDAIFSAAIPWNPLKLELESTLRSSLKGPTHGRYDGHTREFLKIHTRLLHRKFLVAFTRLCKSLCRLDRPSVCPSVSRAARIHTWRWLPLRYCPCPPGATDTCRVYGLIYKPRKKSKVIVTLPKLAIRRGALSSKGTIVMGKETRTSSSPSVATEDEAKPLPSLLLLLLLFLLLTLKSMESETLSSLLWE